MHIAGEQKCVKSQLWSCCSAQSARTRLVWLLIIENHHEGFCITRTRRILQCVVGLIMFQTITVINFNLVSSFHFSIYVTLCHNFLSVAVSICLAVSP